MITLTQSQVTDITNEMMNEGMIDDFLDVRINYSGRGMYGKSCLGFVTGMNGMEFGMRFAKVVETLNEEGRYSDNWEILEIEDFYNSAYDSMGYSMIYFFPQIQVENADEMVTDGA